MRFGAAFNTFYSSNENGRRGSLAVNGSNRYFAFRLAQSLERFGNYSTGKPNSQFLSELRDPLVVFSITDEGEVLNSQSHGSNSQATLRFFLDDRKSMRFNYDRRRGANIGSAGLVEIFNAFFPFSNRDKFNGRYDAVALTRNLQRLSLSGFYQTQYRNFTNILTLPPSACGGCPGIYQFSETVTDTRTTGLDLQTDWTFGSRNSLTAGASFFRDNNFDRRLLISASTPSSTNRRISNAKNVPDASLENIAAFAQDEFRITNRFKLVGGVRIDNFKTAARPTTSFSLPPLSAGQIEDLHIAALASGLSVSNTSVTGDFGGIYRLSREVSLSARVGRSFRTPNVFELFFTGSGSVSGFVVGNANLVPETGTNFDSSMKFRRSRFSGSATYFHNSYKNFLDTIAANDRLGHAIFLNQPGPPTRVYQTQNFHRARIQGFEAEFEAPMKIRLGYLTPNGNFSYLRGDYPDLHVPLDSISPFRANIGIRWNNYGKSYFFDYYARIVATQNRISPFQTVNQGGNGQPEKGFTTHNISGGYYFHRERYNFNVNLGVSNLANRAYSEQFVFAPARGRSFTVGTSWEIK